MHNSYNSDDQELSSGNVENRFSDKPDEGQYVGEETEEVMPSLQDLEDLETHFMKLRDSDIPAFLVDKWSRLDNDKEFNDNREENCNESCPFDLKETQVNNVGSNDGTKLQTVSPEWEAFKQRSVLPCKAAEIDTSSVDAQGTSSAVRVKDLVAMDDGHGAICSGSDFVGMLEDKEAESKKSRNNHNTLVQVGIFTDLACFAPSVLVGESLSNWERFNSLNDLAKQLESDTDKTIQVSGTEELEEEEVRDDISIVSSKELCVSSKLLASGDLSAVSSEELASDGFTAVSSKDLSVVSSEELVSDGCSAMSKKDWSFVSNKDLSSDGCTAVLSKELVSSDSGEQPCDGDSETPVDSSKTFDKAHEQRSVSENKRKPVWQRLGFRKESDRLDANGYQDNNSSFGDIDNNSYYSDYSDTDDELFHNYTDAYYRYFGEEETGCHWSRPQDKYLEQARQSSSRLQNACIGNEYDQKTQNSDGQHRQESNKETDPERKPHSVSEKLNTVKESTRLEHTRSELLKGSKKYKENEIANKQRGKTKQKTKGFKKSEGSETEGVRHEHKQKLKPKAKKTKVKMRRSQDGKVKSSVGKEAKTKLDQADGKKRSKKSKSKSKLAGSDTKDELPLRTGGSNENNGKQESLKDDIKKKTREGLQHSALSCSKKSESAVDKAVNKNEAKMEESSKLDKKSLKQEQPVAASSGATKEVNVSAADIQKLVELKSLLQEAWNKRNREISSWSEQANRKQNMEKINTEEERAEQFSSVSSVLGKSKSSRKSHKEKLLAKQKSEVLQHVSSSCDCSSENCPPANQKRSRKPQQHGTSSGKRSSETQVQSRDQDQSAEDPHIRKKIASTVKLLTKDPTVKEKITVTTNPVAKDTNTKKKTTTKLTAKKKIVVTTKKVLKDAKMKKKIVSQGKITALDVWEKMKTRQSVVLSEDKQFWSCGFCKAKFGTSSAVKKHLDTLGCPVLGDQSHHCKVKCATCSHTFCTMYSFYFHCCVRQFVLKESKRAKPKDSKTLEESEIHKSMAHGEFLIFPFFTFLALESFVVAVVFIFKLYEPSDHISFFCRISCINVKDGCG
jgi:hypothetical protein